jgi:hypothetical protein
MKHTTYHTEVFKHHHLQSVTFFAWSTLTSRSISFSMHSTTLEILRLVVIYVSQIGSVFKKIFTPQYDK